MSLIIAFDRKDGELIDCDYLINRGLSVHVIRWNELQIAMLQSIKGMSVTAFCTTMTQLLSSVLNLFASRRLLSETLEKLFKRKRPNGQWPRLSEWIEEIEKTKANSMSRLGGYREATLYALKTVYNELGSQLDYASSNLFEVLFQQQGCVVILTSGLSTESESLLACLFINYAYHSRASVDPETLSPVFFILDDSLSLLRGSSASDTEGGMNPIANWSFMGRSRQMGIICAAQNYSLLSPAFRNNCSTVMAFGSWRRDAMELSRDLNLTREQSQRLTQLQPGEAVGIARSFLPVAMQGRVPEVK